MSPDTEARLIKRFKAGNENVFEQLWLARCKPLIQMSHAILLGKEVEVDRALGIVRLKYLMELRSENTIQYPFAWLKKTTYNVCIDLLRKMKTNKNALEQLKPENKPITNETIYAEEENEIMWSVFHNVLATYPMTERFLIIAFYLGDWKAKKIADLCDCNVSDVFNLMTRFRNAIRRNLD